MPKPHIAIHQSRTLRRVTGLCLTQSIIREFFQKGKRWDPGKTFPTLIRIVSVDYARRESAGVFNGLSRVDGLDLGLRKSSTPDRQVIDRPIPESTCGGKSANVRIASHRHGTRLRARVHCNSVNINCPRIPAPCSSQVMPASG